MRECNRDVDHTIFMFLSVLYLYLCIFNHQVRLLSAPGTLQVEGDVPRRRPYHWRPVCISSHHSVPELNFNKRTEQSIVSGEPGLNGWQKRKGHLKDNRRNMQNKVYVFIFGSFFQIVYLMKGFAMC